MGIRVPKWFKQSLTTLQISQFVVGVFYAFAHLFVAYQVPVSVPYLYRLGTAASSVLANAPSDISSSASIAVSTASAGAGAWLKKVALRAAGHEGLAENVHNEHGRPFGIDAVHIAEDLVAKEETRYRDELQWVHCLDTSGQVFAILLNCVYLLPLTWLFAQFFITSYLKRVERRRSSSANDLATAARLSLTDAGKGVARRLSHLVEEMHHTSGDVVEEAVLDDDEINESLRNATENARETIKQGVEKIKNAAPDVKAEKIKELFKQDLAKVQKNVSDSADKLVSAVKDATKQVNVQAKAQSLKDTVAEAVEQAAENVKPATEKAVDNTKATASKAAENIKPAAEQAAAKTKAAANKAAESVKPVLEQAAESTKSATGKIAENAGPASEKAVENAKDAATKTADQAKGASGKASKSAQAASQNAKDQAATSSKSNNKKSDNSGDQQGKGGEQTEKPVEPSSPGSEGQNSPNESGTGADEATGQASPSPSKKAKKRQAKKAQAEADNRPANDAKESQEDKQEKKTEDKIIDESQVVRDEDVAAKGDASTSGKQKKEEVTPADEAGERADSGESEVRDGTSFADAVKE